MPFLKKLLEDNMHDIKTTKICDGGKKGKVCNYKLSRGSIEVFIRLEFEKDLCSRRTLYKLDRMLIKELCGDIDESIFDGNATMEISIDTTKKIGISSLHKNCAGRHRFSCDE